MLGATYSCDATTWPIPWSSAALQQGKQSHSDPRPMHRQSAFETCCACSPPPALPPPLNPPDIPPPSVPPLSPPSPKSPSPSTPPPPFPPPEPPPPPPPLPPASPPPRLPPPPSPTQPPPEKPSPAPSPPDPPFPPPKAPPAPPECRVSSRRDTRTDLMLPRACAQLPALAFVCDAWYDSSRLNAGFIQLCETQASAAKPSGDDVCAAGPWLACADPPRSPPPSLPPTRFPPLPPSSPPLHPPPPPVTPSSPPNTPPPASCSELLDRRDTQTLHPIEAGCRSLSRSAFVCAAWYTSYPQVGS